MTRRRPRTVAVALSLLLVAASVAAGAGGVVGHAAGPNAPVGAGDSDRVPATASGAAADADRAQTTGTGADGADPGPITECFAGAGYPIAIGDGGATMEAVIHLSVLTDPRAGNEFGIETAGRLDGEPIVVLAAGVRLTGREAIANGLDPLAAFDVLYTYDLRLPMFDGAVGDAGYEDDGSPIDSAAGAVAC
jgi:hypothetical protein